MYGREVPLKLFSNASQAVFLSFQIHLVQGPMTQIQNSYSPNYQEILLWESYTQAKDWEQKTLSLVLEPMLFLLSFSMKIKFFLRIQRDVLENSFFMKVKVVE